MTLMNFKNPFASLITLIVSAFMVLSVQAQDVAGQKAPELVAKDTITAVIEDIQANKELYQNDSEAMYKMIEEKLIPSIHVTRMAGLIVGRKIREASTEQQIEDFAKEFQTLLIKTNALALLGFIDNETAVSFDEIKLKPGADRVKVNGTMVGAGGNEYQISLHMSNKDDTQWRAYNMIVAGTNIIGINRSTFQPILKKKGIDGLTETLREKNAK